MKTPIKSLFAILLISLLAFTSSCKKDSNKKVETFNNIKLSSVPESVKPSDNLIIQGYFMEQLSNKNISTVSIYVIKNSELYTSRKILGKDQFKSLTSAPYINNELSVVSTGPKSFDDYNVQYNNYDFATAIPISELDVAAGDYLNIGFELINSDGSRTVQTARVDIAD